MAKARTLVGLDVHATKIVAAVLDGETGELRSFAMGGESAGAAGFCAGLPGPVRVSYEAGPTGYGLARELAKRGVECVVAAPSKIPRASGDRVKTDRRDAEHLVRLLLAGKLHPVRVPGDEEEALRDLVRARETVRVDLMRSRHRLSKLLLRHGIRFDDGRAWTERHQQWLATVALDWPAAQTTLLDCRGAVEALVHRREQLEREIIGLLPSSPWAVAGRAVALPARHRHADRRRAVRRDRRLRTLRPRRAVHELRRTGPQRVHDRPSASARSDHQNRLQPRPAATGRSGLALPLTPDPRQSTHRPPSRPAARSSRGRLVSPTTPAPNLGAARSPRETPHDHRRRRRPRARRVLLGNHPHRMTPTPPALIPSTGPVAARHARGTRDSAMSNPPHAGAGHARS